MFEVTLYGVGGHRLYTRKCKVGDLLPTIATILQQFEVDHGTYQYQRNYAIQWRQVSE